MFSSLLLVSKFFEHHPFTQEEVSSEGTTPVSEACPSLPPSDSTGWVLYCNPPQCTSWFSAKQQEGSQQLVFLCIYWVKSAQYLYCIHNSFQVYMPHHCVSIQVHTHPTQFPAQWGGPPQPVWPAGSLVLRPQCPYQHHWACQHWCEWDWTTS